MTELEKSISVQNLIYSVLGLLKPLGKDEIESLVSSGKKVVILDADNYDEAFRRWRSLIKFLDEEDEVK